MHRLVAPLFLSQALLRIPHYAVISPPCNFPLMKDAVDQAIWRLTVAAGLVSLVVYVFFFVF